MTNVSVDPRPRLRAPVVATSRRAAAPLRSIYRFHYHPQCDANAGAQIQAAESPKNLGRFNADVGCVIARCDGAAGQRRRSPGKSFASRGNRFFATLCAKLLVTCAVNPPETPSARRPLTGSRTVNAQFFDVHRTGYWWSLIRSEHHGPDSP